MRTALLLILTLCAFASNSLLNRAALAGAEIDWASFTIIRLMAGAVLLAALFVFQHGRAVLPVKASCVSGFALFAYAGFFSAAYIHLDAGVGALILFPAGQISMQLIGLVRGITPSRRQMLGAATALAGLIYLMAPGVTAPPLLSALMMAGAGIAWGVYSWGGKGVADPALSTARNFIAAALIALFLLPFLVPDQISAKGVVLAVISGAVTSALGYILWYQLLARISITSAAVSQLSVPAIAALGGVLLLGEEMTLRLIIATVIILGGIALVSVPGQQRTG